jgi:Zn-dependent metalloprotease
MVGRNMIDPSRDAAGVVQYNATNNTTKYNSMRNGFYPDHYSIRYTGTRDEHGVHINCPIITHAVYLMMNGGTHRLSNVTVTAIGVAPVEQMLFEVISTGLLTNSSDFADFRLAFIQACQTLYPDNLHYLATVKTAFHAVGIGPGPDSTSSWLSLLLLDDAHTLPSVSWLSLLLLDDARAT